MLGYHPFYFWSLVALAACGIAVISWLHRRFEWPYAIWAAFNLVVAYVLFCP